jgi:cyclopropane fatty-acyl-phospholipid synthase-like methyltransferase
MGPEKERSVIRGGREGNDRLQVSAGSRWADTASLFQRAGLPAGRRCLDVGCRGGAVSSEIGETVAPGGRVVGVDRDHVKLDMAQRAAAERGVDNVEVWAKNVKYWTESGAYDPVYSRALLQHLSRPVELP